MTTRRRLLTNAAALYVVHAANFVIPVFTFPYLVRTLGISQFGTLAYAMAVVQIASAVTEFGLNLTATRAVSTLPNDAGPRALEELMSAVMALKAGVLLCVATLLATLVALIPSWRDSAPLYIALAPTLLGELLLPIWLFQGLQKMFYIGALSVGGRILSLALLVLLVRTPDDLTAAAFVQALPLFVAGILAQTVITIKFRLKYRLRFLTGSHHGIFTDATTVFTGRLAAHFYVRAPLLILGLFTTPEHIGIYSIAQRITGLATQFVQPAAQAVYPHLCTLWDSNRTEFGRFQKKSLQLTSALLGSVAVTIGLVADAVVRIVAGASDPEIRTTLLLLSPIIIISGTNVLLSVIITARKRDADMARLLWLGAAAFAATSIPLTWGYQHLGMAIATNLVEAVMFVGCLWIAHPRRKT